MAKIIRTSFIAAILLFPGAIVAVPAVAQDKEVTASDIRKEAAELTKALDRYSVEQSRKAALRARDALQQVADEIAEFEDGVRARVAREGQRSRERARAAIAKLKERRAEAERRIARFETSSNAAWSDVKAGFVRSYADLREAFASARDEFREEGEPTEDAVEG